MNDALMQLLYTGAYGKVIAAAIAQAVTIATVAKILVDVCKKSAISTPSWTLPILAFVFSVLAATALHLATGGTLNGQSIGMLFIVSVFATGGAIGVTELQRSADKNK